MAGAIVGGVEKTPVMGFGAEYGEAHGGTVEGADGTGADVGKAVGREAGRAGDPGGVRDLA
jgi:hypothetical protein